MDADRFIARLEEFPVALSAVLDGVASDDWAWRPASTKPGGAWSLHDVLVHLVSEETDDFRPRLRLTLEDPVLDWPPLDPEGVVERSRGTADAPQKLLRRFRDDRRASVAWLRGLAAPRWDNAHRHPRGFDLRAGDLLASWTAHDARHLAQVAKLLHGLVARDGAPFSVEYAG